MMQVRTRVRVNKQPAEAVKEGTRKYLLDVAGAGFRKSQQIIAAEAADTSQLLKSGFPPEFERDGSVIWGYAADYARWVDEGSNPHWPPIAPLLGWARRVLGSSSLAYAVQAKIAEEGTEGIDFVERSVAAMRAKSNMGGLKTYIRREL